MGQRTRSLVAVLIIVVIAGAVLGIDALKRRPPAPAPAAAAPTALPPGAVPIYVDGQLAGGITPQDIDLIAKASFTDKAQGVEQSGWLLRDIVLLRVARAGLKPDAKLRVSSSSRNKAAEVTWAEADEPSNYVMFDLSNRGTLKLVSVLQRLDTRDEWVQDVDKIEVFLP